MRPSPILPCACADTPSQTLPRSSTGQHDVEKQPVSPYSHRRGSESSDESYGEQDSFLGRGRPVQQPSTPTPSGLQPIEFSAIFRAPSLMIILGAYSLLTLHSATFDQLLPLLGNAPTDTAGLGLPCSFTPLIVLLASTAASGVVYKSFPAAVSRIGLLQLFRACCFVFPMIYVATPLLSKLARSSQGGIIAAALASVFFKTLVTGSAQTLVAILATNASPDPYSLATIMGFVQCASGVRSLAVAGTAVAYAVGSGVSVWATNVGLWGTMTGVGAVGAAVAWFVRDHPAVSDYCGSLKWEVCYDSVFEEVGPKAEEV